MQRNRTFATSKNCQEVNALPGERRHSKLPEGEGALYPIIQIINDVQENQTQYRPILPLLITGLQLAYVEAFVLRIMVLVLPYNINDLLNALWY